MEPQTQKQQITELLRQADNLIITTSRSPDIDQTAAAIALTEIMTKIGKRADAVVSGKYPKQVSFLPTRLLQQKFNGIRDFVISLNTSHTEADKLKYVPEGKKLNIYITPYNGNFNSEDLSFSYGDYHCDAIVALGVGKLQDIDNEIANQKQLIAKTKIITINIGANVPASGENIMSWYEPNASSVCELLMSLTEALQSGIVDEEIATALLTGIMAKTEHFTNTATTPKVMTMAAQLMAAGAKQPEILNHLRELAPTEVKKPSKTVQDTKERGQLEPAKEMQLPHSKDQVLKKAQKQVPLKPTAATPSAPAPTAPAPETPQPEVSSSAPSAPSPSPANEQPHEEKVIQPPRVREVRREDPLTKSPLVPPSDLLTNKDLPPPLTHDQPNQQTNSPLPSNTPLSSTSNQTSPPNPQPAMPVPAPPELPHVPPPQAPINDDRRPDIESARKAVEEATRNAPTPPQPPNT